MVSIAVVPVAGHGTRLMPLTRAVPKELLPLGRKPVLQSVVEELQQSGIDDIVMVASDRKQSILQQHFQSDALSNIHFADQSEQLGLGHAVLCSEERVGQNAFLIALGDAMIGLNDHASLCRRMIRIFNDTDADAVIAFQSVSIERVSRYGIASVASGYKAGDEFFELSDLVEKPSVDNAPSQFAIAARYVCKHGIFSLLRETKAGAGNEIQLTDALRLLIDRGGKVLGVPITGTEQRYDVGSFDSYFTAFIEAALADPECGDRVAAKLREILDK